LSKHGYQRNVNIKAKDGKGTDRGRNEFREQENGWDKCDMGLLKV
jgi:hypothetical protein